jgi:hypothetical protein
MGSVVEVIGASIVTRGKPNYFSPGDRQPSLARSLTDLISQIAIIVAGRKVWNRLR